MKDNYNTVMVSAINQHRSTTGVYMSPPLEASLPPRPTPFRLSQSASVSSLSDTVNSQGSVIWDFNGRQPLVNGDFFSQYNSLK